MKAWANKQQGVGFVGVILIIAAVLFLATFAMKLVPAYLHNMQIERILKTIVSDAEMQNATVKDIRASYTKRAMMDSITDITAEDVEVSKDAGHISLSANYSVKIPVAGNVSLMVEFKPSAEK
jgi:Domain of unknown function (DUF4845)